MLRPACSASGCDRIVQSPSEHCEHHAALLVRFTRWLEHGFDADRLTLDRIHASRRDR
jgi:hypothetical protein